jgi:hypothetical protein
MPGFADRVDFDGIIYRFHQKPSSEPISVI